MSTTNVCRSEPISVTGALIVCAAFIVAAIPRQDGPVPNAVLAAAPGPESKEIESAPEGADTPSYVGAQSCAACHEDEYRQWRGSHHDLAMQIADNRTVLGDFNDAVFVNQGVRSRFFRKDGDFFVNTDGPDGRLCDFKVEYTFGVYPPQQYLIEFPGGRHQALSICWDSRPAEECGQRWFHLYPEENIDHRDQLHWTGPNQNWNYMCAECHSTNLQKNYDLKTDAYGTTWSEINVACEACHGPGSRHVAWAEALERVLGDEALDLENMANQRRQAMGEQFPPLTLEDFFFEDDAPLHPGKGDDNLA